MISHHPGAPPPPPSVERATLGMLAAATSGEIELFDAFVLELAEDPENALRFLARLACIFLEEACAAYDRPVSDMLIPMGLAAARPER